MGAREPLNFPTGLRRVQAATHIGMSAWKFDQLVKEGVLPPARQLGGIKLWIRQELDDALFSAQIVGTEQGENSCDGLFGVSR